jgi:hypothetical protein
MAKVAAGRELLHVSKLLRDIEQARVSGVMKPTHAGEARQTALCNGVALVAKYFGVTLKPIPGIDANGELSIISQPATHSHLSGAPFSEEFCDVLNTHCRPRCGTFGTVAVMDPNHATWCRINHFEAERLVYAVANEVVL